MHITLEVPDPPAPMAAIYDALVSGHGQLTLLEAAKLVKLSPNAFSRQFNKCTGSSFRITRLEIRLTLGAALLQQTILTIPDIAHHLGYADRYKFERAFKRYASKTPTEYRKSCASS